MAAGTEGDAGAEGAVQIHHPPRRLLVPFAQDFGRVRPGALRNERTKARRDSKRRIDGTNKKPTSMPAATLTIRTRGLNRTVASPVPLISGEWHPAVIVVKVQVVGARLTALGPEAVLAAPDLAC